MFYLTTHSTHFIYGYMASDIWLRHSELRQRLLDLPRLKVGVPYTVMKRVIIHLFSTWQDHWNGGVAHKLYSVKPVLGDWQTSYR